MQTLNALKTLNNEKLTNYPHITHSSLFERITRNLHLELIVRGDKYLLSPLYALLRGEPMEELMKFVAQNEPLLDTLKEFIINSLYGYSAVIEENAYYLSHDQDILIARLLHREELKFEVKFYSHYQEELLSAYNDKIYLGRIFIDLKKFERKNFGLNDYFLSILDQNTKIQERAHHKLRSYEDYKKSDLDEIDYLSKEMTAEAMERIKLFPKGDPKEIPSVKLMEMVDVILYVQNLMIELREFTQEFENRLRAREENNFAKHLTKFSKDLINDIKYLTKLFYLMGLKISNYSPI